MGPACAVEKCKQAITRELRHTPPSQSPSRSVTLTDIRCPMRTYVFACLTDAFSGVLAHSVEAILRMVSRKSPRSGYVTTYPLSARRSGSVMRTIQVCVFSVQVVKCRPTKIFLNRTFLNSSVLPPPSSSSSAFALNNLPSPSPLLPPPPPRAPLSCSSCLETTIGDPGDGDAVGGIGNAHFCFPGVPLVASLPRLEKNEEERSDAL